MKNYAAIPVLLALLLAVSLFVVFAIVELNSTLCEVRDQLARIEKSEGMTPDLPPKILIAPELADDPQP